MDMAKVEAIMSWLTPKHMKNVQAFLGLANFYCCFIQDFSKIATLLCTRRLYGGRGELNRRHFAFDELKRRFVEGPILVAADYMHPLCVESNTSDYATGAVLSMLCEDEM